MARGEVARPSADDPEMEVVQRRGLEHEASYLAELQHAGLNIVEVVAEPFETAVSQTLEALSSGVLWFTKLLSLSGKDGRPSWRGHADFLTRIEVPSNLGNYSYEPEDTKLGPSGQTICCAPVV